MMNRILIIAGSLLFLLVSCKKEKSIENEGGINGTSSVDLLLNVTNISPNDTFAIDYSYDANNKKIGEVHTSAYSGRKEVILVNYYRNTKGIIESASISSVGYPGLDSCFTHYDASVGRYMSKITWLTTDPLRSYDSTVFLYSASGSVTEVDEYVYWPSRGTGLYLDQRLLFTYDGVGNITDIKFVTVDPSNGNEALSLEYILSYDSYTNPLILPFAEAMIFEDVTMSSPNNISRFQIRDISGMGANDMTMDYTYTYNTKNKPVTGICKEGTTVLSNITYTYK